MTVVTLHRIHNTIAMSNFKTQIPQKGSAFKFTVAMDKYKLGELH